MLFRHFTDALVRVGYLKYGRKIDILAQKLEGMFEEITKKMFGLNTTTSTSKNRMKYNDLMKNIYNTMDLMKDVFNKYKKDLKSLFCRYLVKPQTLHYETNDTTIVCRDLILMFKNAGLINDEDKMTVLLRVIERHHD